MINIPNDLNYIQQRAIQACNCYEIEFDTNGSCNKVIFTYKLFQVELMWKL